MKNIIILSFLWFSGFIFSQTENEFNFKSGIEFYNSGDYNEAINLFVKIINNGEHSDELYFNLGNSYYKINDIPNSIYYFEKALQLNPNDKDILNNLTYSQNMLIDKIDILPSNQLSDFFEYIYNFFSIKKWLFIGIIFLFTGISKHENKASVQEAIIFDKKIDFRTEPNYRSEIQFNLHEGTKVTIKEELNDWVSVELINGASGWMESKSIKKID